MHYGSATKTCQTEACGKYDKDLVAKINMSILQGEIKKKDTNTGKITLWNDSLCFNVLKRAMSYIFIVPFMQKK